MPLTLRRGLRKVERAFCVRSAPENFTLILNNVTIRPIATSTGVSPCSTRRRKPEIVPLYEFVAVNLSETHSELVKAQSVCQLDPSNLDSTAEWSGQPDRHARYPIRQSLTETIDPGRVPTPKSGIA